MPGRLPTQGVLVSNGTSGQKYVYAVIQADQDYLIVSAGMFPDAGSLSGQLSGHIGSFRGPMPAAVVQSIAGPTKTDFGGPGLVYGTTFGPEVEKILGDVTDQANFLTPLWGTVNPRFADRRYAPIVRQNNWLVILMFDVKNGDSVQRAAQYEVIGYPLPLDETQDYIPPKGA